MGEGTTRSDYGSRTELEPDLNGAAQGRPRDVATARRMAYADPPYPGQAQRLYGEHPDYRGEVDHRELVADLLARFPDGWALSTSARALPRVLRHCPDRVLVCCWLKRATSPPMGDNRMYSWEPVILCDTPNPAAPTRIHCEANTDQYTFRAKREGYVVGAKPQAFCFWLFDAMGLRPDDSLVDLFPGSGAVGEAWRAWRAQERLPLDVHHGAPLAGAHSPKVGRPTLPEESETP